MGVKTQKLNPPHQYVPWVTVNNGHSSADESAVESNFVGFVCKKYTGPIKIAACQ